MRREAPAAAHRSPPPEWQALAARDPGEVAIALPEATVTVGEVAGRACAEAAALAAAGVRPGDSVVVALPNSADFVVSYLAVRHCGAVFVNAPWQWRRELVAVAVETEAKVVVLDPALCADEALRPLEPLVRGSPLAPAESAAAAGGEPVARESEARAWIAYSSGTTGAPKGAVHTERTLKLIPEGFIARYAIGPEDAVLVAAPVGHAVGFVYGVLLALRARCPMVLPGRWDVAQAAELARRHRATFTAAPTPLLLDVVEFAERHGGDAFATLRTFLCGGASVPPRLLVRARHALPSTETSSYYGTSECGGVATWPPGTDPGRLLAGEGVPLPGMEVALTGGDELLVRGSQLASGYAGADVNQRFRADGWYATGDRATIDEAGAIRLVGRVHDIIRRGGVDVSPTEVEDVLADHPALRHATVFGLADERLGARVVVLAVPRGQPPSLDELREHCRVHGLAKVKWPERVGFVDELPRSPTGKLDRAALPRLLGSAR